MLTMTQVQVPAADMHPDDVVVYWTASHGVQPRLPAPSPDHEAVTPAVIVALYADGGRAEPMAMWARVFRLRPEVRAAREKAAEVEALRGMAVALVGEVFPGLPASEWTLTPLGPASDRDGWWAEHEGMAIEVGWDRSSKASCRWGDWPTASVSYHPDGASLRVALLEAIQGYLAIKRTGEGTSSRIVERRNRARALLAAMGVVDPGAGEE